VHRNVGGVKDSGVTSFPDVPNKRKEFDAETVLSIVLQPTGGILLNEGRWRKVAFPP